MECFRKQSLYMERKYMIQGIGVVENNGIVGKSILYWINGKEVNLNINMCFNFIKARIRAGLSRDGFWEDIYDITHIFDSDGNGDVDIEETMRRLKKMHLQKKYGIINIKVETAK